MTEIVAKNDNIRILSKLIDGAIRYHMERKIKNHMGEYIWLPCDKTGEFTAVSARDKINITIEDILLFIVQAKKEVSDANSDAKANAVTDCRIPGIDTPF